MFQEGREQEQINPDVMKETQEEKNMDAESEFKIGDMVTWDPDKKNEMLAAEKFGDGPFKVVDIRPRLIKRGNDNKGLMVELPDGTTQVFGATAFTHANK